MPSFFLCFFDKMPSVAISAYQMGNASGTNASFYSIVNEKKRICVMPSIFAANLHALADEVKRVEDAGADGVHVDIMDGRFVPNMSMGLQALSAIRTSTRLFIDVHLMAYRPMDYARSLVEHGADSITFHVEATKRIGETLEHIRGLRARTGLAFSPGTDPSLIVKFVNRCDNILVMTVHPGFSGQAFLEDMLERVRFVRDLREGFLRKGGAASGEDFAVRRSPPFSIQVDGGIDDRTGPLCVAAGADSLAVGSYLFRGGGIKGKVEGLQGSAL